MQTNSRHDRIEYVMIRPKVDNPWPFEVSTEAEHAESWGYSLRHEIVSRTAHIADIDLSQWDVEIKVKKSAEFEAVAKIVGKKKAAEVLEVLGL